MKTLILDFDGTIADTRGAIYVTVRATLQHLHLPVPEEHLVRQLIGLPLRDTFTQAAGIKDEALIQECISVYRSRFNEICGAYISLYSGVKETLESLKKAGLVLTIASSRDKDSLTYLLDTLGLTQLMDFIVGEKDVRATKPAPDMVNLILEKTSTPVAEALVVGDTVFDIRMGKAAGTRTCGVTYGNHTRENLLTEQPDYLADSFGELRAILFPGT